VSAVLGVSAGYHDAAAALVVDGDIVCALQEERRSREKGDPSIPRRAMATCLAAGALDARDLDAVIFYENPYAKVERVMTSLVSALPGSLRQVPRAIGAQLGSKVWVLDTIAETLGIERKRVAFVDHHKSHAASAFFASSFERAAILVVDGVGEQSTTSIHRGDRETIELLAEVPYPHSLGLFYAALTAWLGFEVNDGEYKVMGLAAFGTPRYRAEMAKLISLDADGSFALEPSYFAFATDTEVGFSSKLEKLLGSRRPPGLPWDLEGARDRRYADVAASLQQTLEEAMLGLARAALARTGAEDLCLAGGVALNAVANARILRESGCARLFVPPAAGDAGGALGAAILGAIERGARRPAPLRSAALGASISNDEARELCGALGLSAQAVDDPIESAAALLARGKVVAFARGRDEWGPRALGQRSILAAPFEVDTRERINRVIKRREPFRPFAPAVSTLAAPAWFEGAPNDMTPFMTTVCDVREREALAAVTHVDGTARVQTVDAASAPDLAEVLLAFERHASRPVLLNTSLNGAGEPIVSTATDAIAFFLGHAVDAMIVGDLLLEREAKS
jgi:carbamoyltransferase